jgi:hypothetical protein
MPSPDTTYDPETMAILGRVFSAAWHDIQEAGAVPSDQETARAELARRVLAAAAAGERDPERLRRLALADSPLARAE